MINNKVTINKCINRRDCQWEWILLFFYTFLGSFLRKTMSPNLERPKSMQNRQINIGLKTELNYWTGAWDEINSIHSSAVKNQGKKKKKVIITTTTTSTTATTTTTHNGDIMTVRFSHIRVSHGSHVAWREQWKYFVLERTFFPIGKTIYCSGHATVLPFKTSLGVVTL